MTFLTKFHATININFCYKKYITLSINNPWLKRGRKCDYLFVLPISIASNATKIREKKTINELDISKTEQSNASAEIKKRKKKKNLFNKYYQKLIIFCTFCKMNIRLLI